MPSLISSITPDLQPEFLQVVDYIYRRMVNLQKGANVLILTDSRMPRKTVIAFQGVAMMMGAEVMVAENRHALPIPLQPSDKWNNMVKAASREADIIVDMAVGYGDFMQEFTERGGVVVSPGDGPGGWCTEESLIRTMLHVDLEALKVEAEHIAELFTEAETCYVTSEEGTDFEIDIGDLKGDAYDGFLWDFEKQEYRTSFVFLPPAQPGVIVPRGRGDGVIALDAVIQADPAFGQDYPQSPVLVTIEKGRVVDIAGNGFSADRLRIWLESLNSDQSWNGPVHINIGNNPRARFSEISEFERVRGVITFGMGDVSVLSGVLGLADDMEGNLAAPAHWDVVMKRPSLRLDDKIVSENGIIRSELPPVG